VFETAFWKEILMGTSKKRTRPVREEVFTNEPMLIQKVVHEAESGVLARTREALRRAAAGERLYPTKVLSFEDPAIFAELFTPKRYEVFIAVRQRKAFNSIQELSEFVNRDRAGVSRDVQALVKAGLLQLTKTVFPGHGSRNEIKPAADALELHVVV
jgi:predicted transcriptional regulator